MPRFLAVLLIAALLVGCAGGGATKTVVRIDATSVESAEASYRAMMDLRSLPQQLGLAVLLLNLEGVQSAQEALSSERGGAGPIKDKVAGLTAEEIIVLASKVKGLEIGPSGLYPAGAEQRPGGMDGPPVEGHPFRNEPRRRRFSN